MILLNQKILRLQNFDNFLKIFWQDFDIDPDANPESDQVDELLALCVKQALQGGQGDDASTS